MYRRTWIARLVVVAAATGVAIAMCAGSANAGLLPVSVTVQQESGNFRWTYSVVLPTDMKLQAGSYFTIYDFAGYQDGSAMVTAAGPDDSYAQYWSVTTSNLGPTPNQLSPNDNPNIANLTFTYNGPTLPIGEPGSLGLGNFVATSTYGQDKAKDGAFTATNPRAIDGVVDSNLTSTIVPGDDVTTPPGVPEPATLALAGLGLPFVGLARYFRRKQAA